MKIVQYTLLADGTSDFALIPIINWLISCHFPSLRFQAEVVRNLGNVSTNLSARIEASLKQFPCDVLFIHRDAESETHEARRSQVCSAVSSATLNFVPIVPIRMTEAWLLSDEQGIRAAANNRYGTEKLHLPRKIQWESTPDPKNVLFDALCRASGKSGRALKKFVPSRHRHRVAELTPDFSQLRGLQSFDDFEKTLTIQFGKLHHALD